jgi:transcriptional regulator with XRE-family HTH domain
MTLTKELRTRLGLSQEAFSRSVGKSVASIRGYESGREPPVQVLAAMYSLAMKSGLTDIGDRIEHLALDSPAKAQEGLIEIDPAPSKETFKERERLHGLLDFVLDSAPYETACALRETIRVYFLLTRTGMGKDAIPTGKSIGK